MLSGVLWLMPTADGETPGVFQTDGAAVLNVKGFVDALMSFAPHSARHHAPSVMLMAQSPLPRKVDLSDSVRFRWNDTD